MKPKYFLYLGLLVAVLTVAGCSPAATPEPTALPPTDTPAPAATKEVAPSVPVEGEVPMGFTAEGLPYRGDPDAPVTLWEYSDFQ